MATKEGTRFVQRGIGQRKGDGLAVAHKFVAGPNHEHIPDPPKCDEDRLPHISYAKENLAIFMLDVKSGADAVFDIHQRLLNEDVFRRIEQCLRRRWPRLIKSEMRCLLDGPLKFVKLIPPGSVARTEQVLRFHDALTTAHWAGWLDDLVTKDGQSQKPNG